MILNLYSQHAAPWHSVHSDNLVNLPDALQITHFSWIFFVFHRSQWSTKVYLYISKKQKKLKKSIKRSGQTSQSLAFVHFFFLFFIFFYATDVGVLSRNVLHCSLKIEYKLLRPTVRKSIIRNKRKWIILKKKMRTSPKIYMVISVFIIITLAPFCYSLFATKPTWSYNFNIFSPMSTCYSEAICFECGHWSQNNFVEHTIWYENDHNVNFFSSALFILIYINCT